MRGSDTDDIIKELFRSFLRNYQEEFKERRIIHKISRFLHKKATINSKNKNDDECLRWSTIFALNYNEIMKKEFENIFKKNKHEDKDFSSHKRD